jgi:hypothetical protein
VSRHDAKRCSECGHTIDQRWWTRKRLIRAIQRFYETNARPPRYADWRKAGPHNPCAEWVSTVFGSFRAAVKASGINPDEFDRFGRPRWTKDAVVIAFTRWKHDYGFLPMAKNWERRHPSGDYPTTWQVVNLFGSWNAAVVEAGYEPYQRTFLKRGTATPHSSTDGRPVESGAAPVSRADGLGRQTVAVGSDNEGA